MMDDIDEEAAREGDAIKKSFRARQPRKSHGVDPKDEKMAGDILKRLKVIEGKCP